MENKQPKKIRFIMNNPVRGRKEYDLSIEEFRLTLLDLVEQNKFRGVETVEFTWRKLNNHHPDFYKDVVSP
jgi:flagellar assembly factor FliW